MPGLRKSCEGTWRVLWTSWGTWGLILVLLARLLPSCCLSRDVFWPHFGSLGTSWDVLERLFGPSWPKLAQDTKKNLDFWFWLAKLALSWEPKNEKNRCPKQCFFQVRFWHRKNAKIKDFGIPKPFQNPPKILWKSRSQKTCDFPSMFARILMLVARAEP